MSVVFSGKNVLLVDDSIVRGTTMTQIVSMCRRAGAKKVYLASSSPPVRYPNVYGVDMPSRKEFVAHNLSEEEVCAVLGADGLIYQVRVVEESVKGGGCTSRLLGLTWFRLPLPPHLLLPRLWRTFSRQERSATLTLRALMPAALTVR